MIVHVNDNSQHTQRKLLDALAGYDIIGDFTNPGYPRECCIVEAKPGGLIICENDEYGRPLTNATWTVPYRQITSVTIVSES